VLKDGKALETEQENLAELSSQAQTFFARQWPLLQALQVA
jgi:hypothetical protein